MDGDSVFGNPALLKARRAQRLLWSAPQKEVSERPSRSDFMKSKIKPKSEKGRSGDSLSGVDLIAQERFRQMAKEGWTQKHDDSHRRKQLAHAADSYLAVHIHPSGDGTFGGSETGPTYNWPWSEKWWKPSDDPIRNLVKAGALIAAEIDRLQRLQSR